MKLTNDFLEYLGKSLMDPEWPRETRRDLYPEDHKLAREAAALMLMTGVAHECRWHGAPRQKAGAIHPGNVTWALFCRYDGLIYEDTNSSHENVRTD